MLKDKRQSDDYAAYLRQLAVRFRKLATRSREPAVLGELAKLADGVEAMADRSARRE